MWQEMNDKIAQHIMKLLETERLEDHLTAVKVQYALLVILDEGQKFILLSLLFGVFGELGRFYLTFLALGSLRIFMGGSHRSTKLGCLLSSLVNFSMILCFSALCYMPFPVVGGIFSLLLLEIVFCVPLVSPQALHFNIHQKTKMKKKALTALTAWGCVVPFLPVETGNIVFWSFAFQASDFLMAVLFRRGKFLQNTKVRRL